MADYNSANTGVEIDAAVNASKEIMEFVQVYSGSPTLSGVSMSMIPTNPDTGDKTGVYDIIYAGTSTSVDSSSGQPNLSRVWIGNEDQTAGGSGHSDMTNTDMWVSSGDYGSGKFTATLHTHPFSSGSANSASQYIHKIYRLQKLQV